MKNSKNLFLGMVISNKIRDFKDNVRSFYALYRFRTFKKYDIQNDDIKKFETFYYIMFT